MIWSVSLIALASLLNQTSATHCSRALKSPEDLETMPTFDKDISSYLSRNLSKEVWE